VVIAPVVAVVVVPAAVVATLVTTTVLVPDDPHAASVRTATKAGSTVERSSIASATLIRLTSPRQGLT